MSDAHQSGVVSPSDLPDKPSRVFISYSHRDGEHLSDLKDHLSPLVRQRKLELWYDREINAGDIWEQEICQAMEATDIFLMLVSASFIASDYAYGKELTYALMRQADAGVVVIPIVVRPCAWNASPVASPLAQLQALPRDGQAVTIWPNRDEAWLDVVRGVDRVAERLQMSRRAGSGGEGVRATHLIGVDADRGAQSVPAFPGLIQYVSEMQAAIVDIWERLGRLDAAGNQFQVQMTRAAAPPLAPSSTDPTAAFQHAANIFRGLASALISVAATAAEEAAGLRVSWEKIRSLEPMFAEVLPIDTEDARAAVQALAASLPGLQSHFPGMIAGIETTRARDLPRLRGMDTELNGAVARCDAALRDVVGAIIGGQAIAKHLESIVARRLDVTEPEWRS